METRPSVSTNVSNRVASRRRSAAKYQATLDGIIEDSKNSPYKMYFISSSEIAL